MFKPSSKLETWKEEGGKNRDESFFYKSKKCCLWGGGLFRLVELLKKKQKNRRLLFASCFHHSVYSCSFFLDISFFFIHRDRSTKLWHCFFMVSKYSIYKFGVPAVMSSEERKLVDLLLLTNPFRGEHIDQCVCTSEDALCPLLRSDAPPLISAAVSG